MSSLQSCFHMSEQFGRIELLQGLGFGVKRAQGFRDFRLDWFCVGIHETMVEFKLVLWEFE